MPGVTSSGRLAANDPQVQDLLTSGGQFDFTPDPGQERIDFTPDPVAQISFTPEQPAEAGVTGAAIGGMEAAATPQIDFTPTPTPTPAAPAPQPEKPESKMWWWERAGRGFAGALTTAAGQFEESRLGQALAAVGSTGGGFTPAVEAWAEPGRRQMVAKEVAKMGPPTVAAGKELTASAPPGFARGTGEAIGGIVPYVAAETLGGPALMLPMLFEQGYTEHENAAAEAGKTISETQKVSGGALNLAMGLPVFKVVKGVARAIVPDALGAVQRTVQKVYETAGIPGVESLTQALSASVKAGERWTEGHARALGEALKALDKEIGSPVTAALRKVMLNAAESAGTLGAVRTGHNLIAQQSYDPDRPTLQGVPEALATGGIMGALAGSGEAVGKIRSAKEAQEYLRQKFQERPTAQTAPASAPATLPLSAPQTPPGIATAPPPVDQPAAPTTSQGPAQPSTPLKTSVQSQPESNAPPEFPQLGNDPVIKLAGADVVQVPTSHIALRPELMQFKQIDDKATGTNAEDKITAPYDPVKADNLLLWEPKNPAEYGLQGQERYIAADGHHRHTAAAEQSVSYQNAQILRESAGFSANDARTIAAEKNIAGGKGTIYDQAKFIRNLAASHGPDVALERAGQIGARGRKAATIALAADPDLYASFINEQITPEAAAAIANTAPRDGGLQRLGIQRAIAGDDPDLIANFLQAVKAKMGDRPTMQQVDLFASDDAAIKAAEKAARRARAIQKEIGEQINSVAGASRRPEKARQLGVDVKDPAAVAAKMVELQALRDRARNWAMDDAMRDLAMSGEGTAADAVKKLQTQSGAAPTAEAGNSRLQETPPVESEEFRQWFGASKIVDAAGNPRPLYHGSRSDEPITEFRTDYGAYFTSERSYAEFFREVGRDFGAKAPLMYEAFVKLENPKRYDGDNPAEFDQFTQRRIPSSELEAAGHDGEMMVFQDGDVEARVNRPDQIRIIGQSSAIRKAAKYVEQSDIPSDKVEEAADGIARTLSLDSDPRLATPYTREQIELFDRGSTPVAPKPAQGPPAAALARYESSSKAGFAAIGHGNAPALEEALVRGRGRISILLHALVDRKIPYWNIDGAKIETPADFAMLLQSIRSPYFESLKAVVLDKSYRVIASQILTVGTLNESLAHPRDLLMMLNRLKTKSGGERILLAHNHPSGNPTPSWTDRGLQTKLEEVANLAGFELLDHVITDGGKYFSFKEQGVSELPDARKQPWEVLSQDEQIKVDSPEVLESITRLLRNPAENVAHILYVGTQYNLIAIERLPLPPNTPGLEGFRVAPKRAGQAIVKGALRGAAREGAYAVLMDLPDATDAYVMLQRLREGITDAGQIKILDVSWPGMFSAQKAGLLSAEQTAYQSKVQEQGQIESPEFKRWFGKSQVVDEAGKPLVVYHATDAPENFKRFRVPAYFARSPGEAEEFYKDEDQGAGSRLVPVYLKIERPYRPKKFANFAEWDESDIQRLKAKGYDGAIFTDPDPFAAARTGGQADLYAAFEPAQIKSAIGNSGAFSLRASSIVREEPAQGDFFEKELQRSEERQRARRQPKPKPEQFDLFAGSAQDPFNLAGEKAIDFDARQREAEAAQRRAAEAAELQRQQQTTIPGVEGSTAPPVTRLELEPPAIGPTMPADDPTFTAFPVNMPEAVRFGTQLLGVAIKVRKKLGRFAGVFRHSDGPKGEGEIILRADMADLLTEKEKEQLRQDAMDYAERVTQPGDDTNKIAQARYEFLIDQAYEEAKRKPPVQALKVIWHEIGHAIDWLPEKIIRGRGNLFGHIAALRDHLKGTIALDPTQPMGKPISEKDRRRLRKEADSQLRKEMGPIAEIVETITVEEPILRIVGVTPADVRNLFGMDARETMPDLYKWFAEQPAEVKKEIVRKAMKDLLDERLAAMGKSEQIGTRTVKRTVRKKVGREPTPEEIAARFRTLLRAELQRRNLAQLAQVKAELRATIAWWHGTEEIPPYFNNAIEMYAEAFSIFMNNPAALQKRAPTYARLIWNYMDRRPEADRLYKEIQNQIKAGQVENETEAAMLDSWDKTDQASLEQQSEPTMSRTDLLDNVRYHIDRRFGPIYRAAAGSSREPAVRMAIGNFLYRASEHELFLARMNQDVGQPLVRQNLDWKDLGRFLFYRRVIEERFKIFNPYGVAPDRAINRLEKMKQTLGPQRWTALQDAAAAFRTLYEDHVIPAMIDARLWSQELMQLINNNVYYATFDVRQDLPEDGIERLLKTVYGSNVSPHIYRQVGTVKDIKNPATATVLKSLSLISAAARNIAKRESVRMLLQADPQNIMEAEKRWTGKRWEFITRDNAHAGTVVYLEAGIPKAYYVRKVVADALNKSNAIENRLTLAAVQATSTLKGLFTQLNYAFWPVNMVRDIFGWVMQMPGAGPIGWAREFPKAMAAARASVKGRPNPYAAAALHRRMLISRADPQGVWSAVDNEFELKLASYGLEPAMWAKEADRVTRLVRIWNSYRELGQMFERVNKIAAMNYLDRKFPNMPEWQKREIVRERGGSPDFLQRGASNPYIDFVMMFYNPWKEGIRSVARSARANPWSFAAKAAAFVLMPVLVQALAASGVFGDKLRRMYRSIPDYDLSNYLCIPLGWQDESTDKVAYFRLPLWEPARIVHGTMWQFITGRGQGLASFYGGTVPSVNAMLNVGRMWIDYEVFGHNPYDSFRGKAILSDTQFAAGGWQARQVLLKQSWNNLGGALVTRFQNTNIETPATGSLEKFLQLPIINNAVNRWVKVSNRGLDDYDRELSQPMQELRAQTRLAVHEITRKMLDHEALTPPERFLMRDPYAQDYLLRTLPEVTAARQSNLARRLQSHSKDEKLQILRAELAR